MGFVAVLGRAPGVAEKRSGSGGAADAGAGEASLAAGKSAERRASRLDAETAARSAASQFSDCCMNVLPLEKNESAKTRTQNDATFVTIAGGEMMAQKGARSRPRPTG